jgi:hypothetical protein
MGWDSAQIAPMVVVTSPCSLPSSAIQPQACTKHCCASLLAAMSWLQKLLPGSSSHNARSLKRRHTPMNDMIALSAEDHHDGTFLKKFCQRSVNLAIQELGRPTWSVTQVIASLCTGSHCDGCILEATQEAFAQEGVPGVQFQIGFTVEMVPDKINFISKIQEAMMDKSAFFPDGKSLLFPQGRRPCNFTALQDCWLAQVMAKP